jgi:Ner family transcriptional regulator
VSLQGSLALKNISPEEAHSLIKVALKAKRTNLSDIARRESMAPTTIASVARGRIRSRRVEKLLAEATGFTVQELWPDRYRAEEIAMSG